MLQEEFKKYCAQTTDHPVSLEVDRAEGIYIWDRSGKKYIDMVSGLAVNNIGHNHPNIIQAIKNQSEKYLHVMPYGEFIQDPQLELAKKLDEILPPILSNSYFVNSGTEANEAAIKLAKRFTGKSEIIAFHKSYHGSTHGSLSISGNETKKSAFRPLLPDIRFLQFNVKGELDKISERTAAVIIEPIQGDAGVRIPDADYMRLLRAKCTQTNTLLIFDEIQTGFGRTGKMFAFEHFDVVPDILTIAKALGGGMPIGALVSSKEIMSTFSHDPMLGHITTFGGHPVNCAAANAMIKTLEKEDLISSVEKKGALIEDLIKGDSIVEIRRKGLMIAIEFDGFEWVKRIFYKNLDKGLITFWFISCNNSFRLAPPLIISEEQINEACVLINRSIKEVELEMKVTH